MRIVKTTLLTVLLACAMPAMAQQSAVPARVEEEKAALIREMLDTTGAMRMGNNVVGMMLAQLKQANPQVDPAVFDQLGSMMDIRELEEDIVALYDRHFSDEDIRNILAFYQTDTGRRMLERMPVLARESMALGQQWGMRKEQALIRALEQEAGVGTSVPQPPVIFDDPR